ncbi:MAG: peptide deformylase [Planctomycetota bacterium]
MSEETEELEYDLTLYPSPVLRKRAQDVIEFGEPLEQIVRAMFRRMYASEGVGLAAPQVGMKKRILVANHSGEEGDELVLINPKILERSGAPTTFEEGCLSFPGIFAEVERPDACKVRAQNVAGEEFEAEYAGFLSRVVQHEYDHLEGVLLVDRMSPADKHRHRHALEALKERYSREKAKLEAAAGRSRR